MLTTRKAQELDVVELTEDLPEFGLKKGERGAVVVAFEDPNEAYDLEFVDKSGKPRFAYAVKPEQIKMVWEAGKELFRREVELHGAEKNPDADNSHVEATQTEIISLVQGALTHLNAREKEIIHLHYWADQSYEEIAQRLGLTVANVAKICQRAIYKLRERPSVERGGGRDENK
jgi:RNA polymerase sigma factor (sigma-70 family)